MLVLESSFNAVNGYWVLFIGANGWKGKKSFTFFFFNLTGNLDFFFRPLALIGWFKVGR